MSKNSEVPDRVVKILTFIIFVLVAVVALAGGLGPALTRNPAITAGGALGFLVFTYVVLRSLIP